MSATFDAAIGATSTTTPSAASLNHAANVIIIINIAYIGTTSPNAVTVGGVSATFIAGSKVSSGTNNSTEAWYIFRAAAANESVSIGFAAAPRVAWNAVSYTVADFSFESLLTNNGSGASVQTSTVTPPAGTVGRLVICGVGGGQTANATGSIAIAATGSGTVRDSDRELAGSSSTKAVGARIKEFLDNTGTYAATFTLTKSSATIGWATWAIGLKPVVSFNISCTDGKIIGETLTDKSQVTRAEPRTIGDAIAPKTSVTRAEPRTIGDAIAPKTSVIRAEPRTIGDAINSPTSLIRSEPFTIGEALQSKALIIRAEPRTHGDAVQSKPALSQTDGLLIGDVSQVESSITRVEPRTIGDVSQVESSITRAEPRTISDVSQANVSITRVEPRTIGDVSQANVSITRVEPRTIGDAELLNASISETEGLVIGDAELLNASISETEAEIIGETLQLDVATMIAEARILGDLIQIKILNQALPPFDLREVKFDGSTVAAFDLGDNEGINFG